MAGSSILDADMATLGQWLKQGYVWWIEELRGLVPARFQAQAKALTTYIDYRGPGDFTATGSGFDRAVLLDPALCLIRAIPNPGLGEADLARMIALDADRLFPLPAAQLALGHAAERRGAETLTVAALPLARAQAVLDEVRSAGFAPSKVALGDPQRPGVVAVDLTPGLAEAGLLPARRDAAARWWAVVALLFVVNVGVLVWRDAQTVTTLETLVEAQAPAVKAARTITSRIAVTQRNAVTLAERRHRQDPLAVLAATTRALPAASWVQRYDWDGSALRLSGYRRADADVAGALRSSGRFADIRSNSAEAMAELPTGQPFDLTARITGHAAGAKR